MMRWQDESKKFHVRAADRALDHGPLPSRHRGVVKCLTGLGIPSLFPLASMASTL